MKNSKKTTAHQSSTEYSATHKISSNLSPVLAELQAVPLPDSFYAASGPLRFTITNDAMFHIVFEANAEALKAFLCSLLRLNTEEIFSVEVTNPIEFGNSIYSKSFVLDLRLLLNNRAVINLEMQVKLPQAAIARMQVKQTPAFLQLWSVPRTFCRLSLPFVR